MSEVIAMFPPRAGISPRVIVALRGGAAPEVREALEIAERLIGIRLDSDSPAARACLEDGVVGQVVEMAVGLGLYNFLLASEVRPALITGHSMGLYTALAATGCVAPEAALELFAADLKRVRALGGGMAVVIGIAVENVEWICSAWDEVWVSCYNGEKLCGVSGTPLGLALLETWVRQAGGQFRRFAGYGPWHCRLVKGIEKALLSSADQAIGRAPEVPILIPLPAPRPVRDRAAVVATLVEQHSTPVHWSRLCRDLLGREDTVCFEVGPAGTLAKFLQGAAAPRRLRTFTDMNIRELARA